MGGLKVEEHIGGKCRGIWGIGEVGENFELELGGEGRQFDGKGHGIERYKCAWISGVCAMGRRDDLRYGTKVY